MGGMMNMGGMMGGVMVWAILVLLLLLAAAVAAVIVLAVRAGGQGASKGSEPAPGSNEAHRVLRKRFAAGEIDDEEYQRRRTVLGDD